MNNNISNWMDLVNFFADDLFGEQAVINKSFSPNTFLKTYLSLATNLDEKSLDVLIYMMNNANENNIYEGTYDTITSDLKISRASLATIMTNLQEKKIISKESNGWKLNSSINVPQNGQNIVIRFDRKVPEVPEIKKEKPVFPFDDFRPFLYTYMQAANKTNHLSEDAFKEAYANAEEELKTLKNEYIDSNTTDSFKEYINNIKNKEIKNEKIFNEAIDKYNKIDKNKAFVCDFEEPSIEDTKRNYIKLINDNQSFSSESKALMRAAIIQIFEVCAVIGKYDTRTVEFLINNHGNSAVKQVSSQFDYMARRFRSNQTIINSLMYYCNKYEGSRAQECLMALLVEFHSGHTLVKI